MCGYCSWHVVAVLTVALIRHQTVHNNYSRRIPLRYYWQGTKQQAFTHCIGSNAVDRTAAMLMTRTRRQAKLSSGAYSYVVVTARLLVWKLKNRNRVHVNARTSTAGAAQVSQVQLLIARQANSAGNLDCVMGHLDVGQCPECLARRTS